MSDQSRGSYAVSTFDLDEIGELRIVVQHVGDPVEISFGSTALALPPGLAIAVGKAIAIAGASSVQGARRRRRAALDETGGAP